MVLFCDFLVVFRNLYGLLLSPLQWAIVVILTAPTKEVSFVIAMAKCSIGLYNYIIVLNLQHSLMHNVPYIMKQSSGSRSESYNALMKKLHYTYYTYIQPFKETVSCNTIHFSWHFPLQCHYIWAGQNKFYKPISFTPTNGHYCSVPLMTHWHS